MTNTKIAAPRVRLRKTPSLSLNRPSTFERMTTSSEADAVLPRDRARLTTGFLPRSCIFGSPRPIRQHRDGPLNRQHHSETSLSCQLLWAGQRLTDANLDRA